MKFSLTKTTKRWCGITLYQIKAEMSFGNVVKGEFGGYIEKRENLSQDGNAWVYGNARVSGNAEVYGNARVYGNAWVYGNAEVYGNAWVSGDAWVYGKLQLTLGYFFGYKEKKEELEYFDLDNNYQLIGKGDCRVKIENEKKSLSGKVVKVGLDGISYEAVIK